MKVPFEKFKAAVVSYIESDILAHFDGAMKYAGFVAVPLLLPAYEAKVKAFLQAPAIQAAGIMDDSGMLDVDMLRPFLAQAMQQMGGSVTQVLIPGTGPFTFHQADIDKIYALMGV